MLKMLADCNGDPYTAAAKYNISLTDLFTVRESLSPAIWIALRESQNDKIFYADFLLCRRPD